jgi:hypothetical protein
MINWKRYGSKELWPVSRYLTNIFWEKPMTVTKNFMRIAKKLP